MAGRSFPGELCRHMSNIVSLHAHDRLVTTPFGLLGTDENALSFALGYTFQQCSPFLQWFLRQVGIVGVHTSSLHRARIDLQRRRTGDPAQGITDIEIHLPGRFHVIVEVKVGLAVPAIKQCQRYMKRLSDTNEPEQRLVALVQSPDDTFVQEYAQQDTNLATRLVAFGWPQFLPACVRLMLSEAVQPQAREWVRSFYRFLDEEYEMRAFTTEVWILAASTKPLWANGKSHWDIHQQFRVWWDYKEPTVRPLYMAFRVGGTLDSIYRVSRVEHGIPIIDVVPILRNVRKRWPKVPCTIWYFEPPVKLAKAIRTGGGMYNRRVRCDLDLLLSCDTVQEIEVAMGERRRQGKLQVSQPGGLH